LESYRSRSIYVFRLKKLNVCLIVYVDGNEDESIVTNRIVSSYQKLPLPVRRTILSMLKDLTGILVLNFSDGEYNERKRESQ
jgi:hypothetical protein